jgi:hypothetical protein
MHFSGLHGRWRDCPRQSYHPVSLKAARQATAWAYEDVPHDLKVGPWGSLFTGERIFRWNYEN